MSTADLALHPADRRRLAWWVLLAFVSLAIAVVTGFLGTLEYAPEWMHARRLGLTLQHLRPLHTTFATAWVFLGATAVLHAAAALARPGERALGRWTDRAQWWLWCGAGAAMLVTLAAGVFSGREYLECHPLLSVPVLAGWGCLIVHWARATGFRLRGQPVYAWMWNVGLWLFVYTFVEAHLYLFDGIAGRPARDIALQWKAYGALVGSFNLLVYGAIAFVAGRVAGTDAVARSNAAFALFFVGLLNSLTNFAHHTYHLPQSAIVKWVSFVVSMAELVILAKVLADVVRLLGGWPGRAALVTRACLAATTVWTLLQMTVSILISVPPINALFHGTHVVTAHAMGSMLGIDSMALFGACAWVLVAAGAREAAVQRSRAVLGAVVWLNAALLPFWVGLLIHGVAVGMQRYAGASAPPVYLARFPLLFAWSGAAAAVGILWLVIALARAGWRAAAGRAPRG